MIKLSFSNPLCVYLSTSILFESIKNTFVFVTFISHRIYKSKAKKDNYHPIKNSTPYPFKWKVIHTKTKREICIDVGDEL